MRLKTKSVLGSAKTGHMDSSYVRQRTGLTSPVYPSAMNWRALRHPVFRALWIASVASNFGTWVQSVGASWLMTSLAASATMVALVQAMTSLPLFLLSLPAGALADVVDRRRVLLFTQSWML